MIAAFRINMWTWAKEQRFLTHRLCPSIQKDQPQRFAAIDWETILHCSAGILGDDK
jgi:hypothetical protein